MKKILALMLALLTVLSLASCAVSIERIETAADGSDSYSDWEFNPPCWHVTSKDGAEMYLFGTIHVGDERSESIMKKVGNILDVCDALAVEFDVVAYAKDPSSSADYLYSMLYTDGSKIYDHVPADLYEKMKDRVEDAGFPATYFENYNITFWEQLLTEVYMGQASLSAEFAMDSMLIYRAYETDKKLLEVESAEFQMNLLGDVDEATSLLLVEDMVNISPALYNVSLNSLYNMWLLGDDELFENALEQDMSSGELTGNDAALMEDYNNALIRERNLNMTERAIEYLNSGDTVFFAVGSGHMLGKNGIASLLNNKGYKVERININDFSN